MKIMRLCCVTLCIFLLVSVLSGCSQGGKQATQIMTDYLNHLNAEEYSKAYALLSDFDKGNISEESFIKWQEQAAQIAKTESFTIDGKIDTFKDYKYLGTEFGTVYGLKVDRKRKVFIPDIEQAEYDKDTFRIMVQMQGDDGRVLLLLTDLDETIATYDAYLQKLR